MPSIRRSIIDPERLKTSRDTQPSETGNPENVQQFRRRYQQYAEAHQLLKDGTPSTLAPSEADTLVSRFAEIDARRRASTKPSDQSPQLDPPWYNAIYEYVQIKAPAGQVEEQYIQLLNNIAKNPNRLGFHLSNGHLVQGGPGGTGHGGPGETGHEEPFSVRDWIHAMAQEEQERNPDVDFDTARATILGQYTSELQDTYWQEVSPQGNLPPHFSGDTAVEPPLQGPLPYYHQTTASHPTPFEAPPDGSAAYDAGPWQGDDPTLAWDPSAPFASDVGRRDQGSLLVGSRHRTDGFPLHQEENSLDTPFAQSSWQVLDPHGKRQKGAILPDSVDLVQAQNCQADLTHAYPRKRRRIASSVKSHDWRSAAHSDGSSLDPPEHTSASYQTYSEFPGSLAASQQEGMSALQRQPALPAPPETFLQELVDSEQKIGQLLHISAGGPLLSQDVSSLPLEQRNTAIQKMLSSLPFEQRNTALQKMDDLDPKITQWTNWCRSQISRVVNAITRSQGEQQALADEISQTQRERATAERQKATLEHPTEPLLQFFGDHENIKNTQETILRLSTKLQVLGSDYAQKQSHIEAQIQEHEEAKMDYETRLTIWTSIKTQHERLRHDLNADRHDIQCFDAYLQSKGKKLIYVSGSGIKGMIRALLASHGHNQNTLEFEQKVQNIIKFVAEVGIPTPGALLNPMVIGYFRGQGLDPHRGITILTFDPQTAAVQGTAVIPGTDPTLSSYVVCRDLQGLHYGVHQAEIQAQAPASPSSSQEDHTGSQSHSPEESTADGGEEAERGRTRHRSQKKDKKRYQPISPGRTPRDVPDEQKGNQTFAATHGTYQNYEAIEKQELKTGQNAEKLRMQNKRPEKEIINANGVSKLATGQQYKVGKWTSTKSKKKERYQAISPGGTPRDVPDKHGGSKVFAATHGTYQNYEAIEKQELEIEQTAEKLRRQYKRSEEETINANGASRLANGQKYKIGKWTSTKPKETERYQAISPGGTPRDVPDKYEGSKAFAATHGTYQNYEAIEKQELQTERTAEKLRRQYKRSETSKKSEKEIIDAQDVSKLATGQQYKIGKWTSTKPKEKKKR